MFFILVKFVIIDRLFASPDDDAHIWDILKSKLVPTFRTFDTQLYTCAKEFDFIEMATIVKLCRTGLVPLSLVILIRFVYDFLHDLCWPRNDTKQCVSNHYHLIQSGVYLLMGIFIMRLKLFSVPQMCLLVSFYMNDQFWPNKFLRTKKWKFIVFLVIVLGMSIEGRSNIKRQISSTGKSNHWPTPSHD
jgi:C-mannosyltransferase DPY19L